MIPAYCPRCGTELGERDLEGRTRKWCAACERPVYRNAVPTAGVTVVDGGAALLVRRDADPGRGEWSIPGGHLEVEEDPREGAVRELREETGLRVSPGDLRLLEATQLDPWGEKHVVSVGYAAAASDAAGTPQAGSDAADVAWLPLAELGSRPVRPHVERRMRAALDAVDE